jgi:serine/threonine protein kinase
LPPRPPSSLADTVDYLATGSTSHSVNTSGLPVTIPGYEIEGELGRGGMGVIYLARQIQPRRRVALKMILANEHASAEQRARFRAEAEAVARLHHPGIVQVHQVGEAQGRPFLTLEYVAGGSLAQHLRQQSLAPRQAAELVRQLSRAVHHAHTEGILHRDLKPANVLLAPTADGGTGPLSWVPKLTDFGLAKPLAGMTSLAGDGPHTSTGAILGTPGYMAPEQVKAGGQTLTPAVDVYALGAILYELLTTRPPFEADSMLIMLMLVATEEPVPPRQRQPELDLDLDTICLKCLRKKPEQRYPSAAALADDLSRYLAGKPIQARAESRLEKFARTVHKRKELLYLASGATAVLLLAALGTMLFAWLGAGTPAATTASPVVENSGAKTNKDEPINHPKAEKKNSANETGFGKDMDKVKRTAAWQLSQNNLKQLVISLENMYSVANEFPPPAITDRFSGRPLLSWRVAILPFLGYDELYQQFHREEPWDSPHNKKLLEKMPKVYAVEGGRAAPPGHTYYQVFVGPGSIFEPTMVPGFLGQKGRSKAEVGDGLSNTILIVEAGTPVPWTSPVDLEFRPGQPLPPLGGPFKDRIHAAFADTRVFALRPNLPPATLSALITRSGFEVVSPTGCELTASKQ